MTTFQLTETQDWFSGNIDRSNLFPRVKYQEPRVLGDWFVGESLCYLPAKPPLQGSGRDKLH